MTPVSFAASFLIFVFSIINLSIIGKHVETAFTMATLGSPISPIINFLRNIRDNSLRRSRVGTLFVNSYEWIYYKITPEVAKVVIKNHRFKNFWKKLVVTPVTYFLTGIFKIISKMRKRTLKLITAQNSRIIIN